ncbi:unnamed protein product, partial [Closterium sp. NIES-54]
TFTLLASPQQNGIAERRIGMVMDVARTSMIHAAAPHFLWRFAVQYAAHQLNLQPRVSVPETSPTLRWTGKVGDASAFRVWGSRAFVRDLSADKLSPRVVPCVFLGFPSDAPGWQFYHPTSRRVLSSQDVTFDESVPYYRLIPYRTAPLPPPPLFLAPGPPPVDPLPPQGPAPSDLLCRCAVRLLVTFLRHSRPHTDPDVPLRLHLALLITFITLVRCVLLCVQSQSQLQPVSPLPAPSPYAGPTGGLAERREPASRPASPVRTTCTSRRAPHPRPPAVPGTHQMTLRPSTAPLRVALPSPPESSLPVLADPASDSFRAASPSVTRLLSTVVTDPSFESTAASALVAESASVFPPSVEGENALSTDVLEDRQEEFQFFAAALPHLVQAMDAEMASSKSTGTYVNDVPPPGANIVSGMWIFRVKRPPGSPPVFKARYVARGFTDLSLFLRTDTSLPPFYILVYVDDLVFATADTAGLAHVKSELQKRHTCTDLGELRSYLGLQITRDRAQRTITLTQSHMVQQVLQRFDFTYSSPQATPLSTRHSLSALPSDESVEPSGPYPELVGCLMYLMTCTRPDLAYPLSILARYVAPGRHRPEHMAAAKRVLRYLCSTSGLGLVLGGRRPVVLTGHADTSWADDQATQRSSQGYTFSLGSGSVSWRSTRSSSVLGSSYNKAMLAMCREHRLEHRTKHIALRYFLARELQQRGQLRLAYMASKANTADIFTKALPPGDHQRFCTMLGFPTYTQLIC